MLAAGSASRSDLVHNISGTPLSRCTSGTSTPLFHDFRNFAGRVRGCNLGLKCAHAQWEWCTARTGRKVVANVSETAKETVAEVSKNRRGYTDVQGAPRFPIKLPVALKSTSAVNQSGVTDQGVAGKTVETENISANGVLFRMDADVPVGSAVDFTLSLPADVVGAEADVQVDCRGRVVRSFEDGGRRGVGVVIDEYRFERR
jgi:PilZ domain-containing protein